MVKIPKIIPLFFGNYLWHFSRKDKVLYLTFDDGPIPKITPWVLEILKEFNAYATFFCIGKNVAKNPNIFNKIIKDGHVIGNHTYNHLNGITTKTIKYLNNIEQTHKEFLKNKKFIFTDKPLLFRPPYGKFWPKQLNSLIKKNYKPVFWDVLSLDFDLNISKEKCLNNVLNSTKNGSIIVFHDSEKAFEKLQYILPKVLKYFTLRGYQFKAIKDIA